MPSTTLFPAHGVSAKVTKPRSRANPVKPILKKLSQSEKNSLDLSRDWDDQKFDYGVSLLDSPVDERADAFGATPGGRMGSFAGPVGTGSRGASFDFGSDSGAAFGAFDTYTRSGGNSRGSQTVGGPARSARDVSFALAHSYHPSLESLSLGASGNGGGGGPGTPGGGAAAARRFAHARTLSGASHTSVATTASGPRMQMATHFVHPFQQTPRTATPPVSYANSLASLDNLRDYSPVVTDVDDPLLPPGPADSSLHLGHSHHHQHHNHHESSSSSISTQQQQQQPQREQASSQIVNGQRQHSPASGNHSQPSMRRPSLGSQRTPSLSDVTAAHPIRANTASSSRSQTPNPQTRLGLDANPIQRPELSRLHLTDSTTGSNSISGTITASPIVSSPLANAVTTDSPLSHANGVFDEKQNPDASYESNNSQQQNHSPAAVSAAAAAALAYSPAVASPLSSTSGMGSLRSSLEGAGFRLRARSEANALTERERVRQARAEFEERQRLKQEKYERRKEKKHEAEAKRFVESVQGGGGGSGGVGGSRRTNTFGSGTSTPTTITTSSGYYAGRSFSSPAASNNLGVGGSGSIGGIDAASPSQQKPAGKKGTKTAKKSEKAAALAKGRDARSGEATPGSGPASRRQSPSSGRTLDGSGGGGGSGNKSDPEQFVSQRYKDAAPGEGPKFCDSVEDAAFEPAPPRRNSTARRRAKGYWISLVLWVRTAIMRMGQR